MSSGLRGKVPCIVVMPGSRLIAIQLRTENYRSRSRFNDRNRRGAGGNPCTTSRLLSLAIDIVYIEVINTRLYVYMYLCRKIIIDYCSIRLKGIPI